MHRWACAEVLAALADAKLPWRRDAKATEGASTLWIPLILCHLRGLQLFALHCAEELGAFSALQTGQMLNAFARLAYVDEDKSEVLG